MIKEIKCNECKSIIITDYLCDICGKKLSYNGYLIREIGNLAPLILVCGDTEYHFCCEGHTIQFLANKLRKKGGKND